MSRTMTLAQSASADLRALRRRLHAFPEVGNDLPQTQATVLEQLAGLDLEVVCGTSLSSVVAVLRGRRQPPGGIPRQAVLLRADLDALPVTEALEHDWVSTRPGLMHACGHDLHTAALVGAARILHELRDELTGDVVLMFQPGEEGPGGAEPMLAEGLLEAAGTPVTAAYAVHVYSADHPTGTWFARPGVQMAACDEVVITVRGRGGHGSAPHRSQDPVPVACEVVLALQSAVTRRFSIWEPVVVTVGRVAAGTANNIIPDSATLDLTVRSFSAESRDLARRVVAEVAEHVSAAHGLSAEVELTPGYPALVNDPTELAFARETVQDLFGEGSFVEMADPEAGGEDMAFVLERVPGAYLNLSAVVGDLASAEDNHSPRADFDDAVVPRMAALLAELALRRCRTSRAAQ